ncbi:NUDIX hydrolase [Geotalea sp. SG265]|uniref:NUDIX hydrolase n=1 Tax=Geotalea sp. SG265 TaxID=2922867 RepID=UPI001FAE9643|nr:NUDIX hydrolase [Geotalea sp. SG265]
METRNGTMVFNGIVVAIEQMEVKIGDKGWHPYQIVRHPGGVGILPLHEDGTVTLIRQLRPATGGFTLELPAGRLCPDEAPDRCAHRELMEETGLLAAELISLGCIYSSPGFLDERIHLFLATGLSQGEPQPEVYEDIEPVRLSLDEALAMAMDGRIADGKTITALYRAHGRKK